MSCKKQDFINPSEFSEKTLVLIRSKNRCRFEGKTQKITCSWWPLQQGMRLHCDFIIKNGHFWPFFAFCTGKYLKFFSKIFMIFFFCRHCGQKKSIFRHAGRFFNVIFLISFFHTLPQLARVAREEMK